MTLGKLFRMVVDDVGRSRHPAMLLLLVAAVGLFVTDLRISATYSQMQSAIGIQTFESSVSDPTNPCLSVEKPFTPRCEDISARNSALLNINYLRNSVRLGSAADRITTPPGILEFATHETSTGWGFSICLMVAGLFTGLQIQNGEARRTSIRLGSDKKFVLVRTLSITVIGMTVAFASVVAGFVWSALQHGSARVRTDLTARTPQIKVEVDRILGSIRWGETASLVPHVLFAVASFLAFALVMTLLSPLARTTARTLAAGIMILVLLALWGRHFPASAPSSLATLALGLGNFVGLHDSRSWLVVGRPTFMGELADAKLNLWISLAATVTVLVAVFALMRWFRSRGHE